MRNVTVCAVVLASLLASPARAADKDGQFGIRGAGLLTCQIFERERAARSPVYHVVAGWLDGYIAGVNERSANTYDVASFESTELMMALISQHCKKNPETLVYAVARSLVVEFESTRLNSASPKQEVALGERRVSLYKEVVARGQKKLTELGFYKGAVDGDFGPKTIEALKRFQRSIGFDDTGFPDQVTLWRLLKGGAPAPKK